MEDSLRARVVGQDHVVGMISDAVRISRAGLQAPMQPVASFLFLGLTGVGKVICAGYILFCSFSSKLRWNCARRSPVFCLTTSIERCKTFIAYH